MARGFTAILALGAAATPALGFNLAPRVIMKQEKPHVAKAVNVLKKAGAVLPAVFLPFSSSFASQAAVPQPESAVNKIVERGTGNTVAWRWGESFGDIGNNPSSRNNVGRPSGKESFRLGIQELRRAMNDPRELQEAMNLLKDPRYRAEVQRLQNDPAFQRELRSFTQSREFQQALQQARQLTNQLQNNPQALEQLRNQLLR